MNDRLRRMLAGTSLLMITAMLSLAAAGCGDDDGGKTVTGNEAQKASGNEVAPEVESPDVTGTALATLAAVDGSGVTGTAAFTPGDDATSVVATVQGADDQAVLAVHEGTCEEFGDVVSIELESPTGGTSTSDINETIGELMQKTQVVVVRKSAAEFDTVLACGLLTIQLGGGEDGEITELGSDDGTVTELGGDGQITELGGSGSAPETGSDSTESSGAINDVG